CIPGTALKGVLRSWGERFFTSDASTAMLRRIFGQRDIRANDSESGWAEFTAAMVERPPTNLEPYAAHVPYWRAERLTGILSHVAIDAATGAAARNKLYFEEFVPEGVSFDVEILATRLDPAEIELLLALLEQGAHHPTHPYQFGANGADGWGRMDWSLVGVYECSAPPTAIATVGFAACAKPYTLSGNAKLHAPAAPPPHVALELTLDFEGPLLVDDKSQAKEPGVDNGRTNFTRLRRANGDTWLPASSFRGVLRGRAEFILRSLQVAKDSPAAGEKPAIDDVLPPIERVFGATSLQSRLTIEEFVEATDSDRWRTDRRQDFVAIDRFLGGAAEGAKFDARFADRPRLTSRLVLDLEELAPEDVALAAAALRDVCSGVATFGFGGSKGYGRATGTVRLLGLSGVDPDWLAPESLLQGKVDESGSKWLSDRLSRLLPTAVAVPALVDLDVPAPVIPVPGKLMLQTTKKGDKRVVTWLKKNGKWTETPTPIDDESQVSRTLMNRRDREIEVDLELDAKNKPVRIRPRGEPWVAEVAVQSFAGRFAHPYYFARLVSRTGPAFQGELGDR
ncbi:MAG TPA: RAMP superfamily CRISPR-associated protein, partial [Pirellulaceae bacterium]|nr:RAMP superfamily CRISPR-associated protein [Pirellulaceae bacterium]